MVSIIVPVWNGLEYLVQLMESIETYTPEKHEIIFINNGSNRDTTEWMRGYAQSRGNVTLIENPKNLGFPKACNQGMRVAKGKYIAIVNSDVVVTPDWLKGLIECIETHPEAGIVGPMTNCISGPQQISEGNYNSLFGLIEFSRLHKDSFRGLAQPFFRIVFFCVLIKSELLKTVGTLDERYTPGNFEDDDYCVRAQLAGYRLYIARDVFVHHHGSRSHVNLDHQKLLNINKAKFEGKWKRWTEEHNSISCVTIVKNESGNIDWFIDKILPHVDELVLVDTGSTDDTVAKIEARQNNKIKLYHFEWCDDFSKARNFANSKATKSWILSMDADECIPQFTKDILWPVTAFSIETRNYTPISSFTHWRANKGEFPEYEVGSGWFPSRKVRLWPNDQRIWFQYPVHEVVEESVYRLGWRIMDVSFPVHHYGKFDLDKDCAKGEKYLKYLEGVVAENPDDLRSVEELATQLQNLGRRTDALPFWERYRDLTKNDPQAQHNAWLNIGHCQTETGDFTKAAESSRKAWELKRDSREAATNFAIALFFLGQFKEAGAVVTQVLRSNPDYPNAWAVYNAVFKLFSEHITTATP